MPAKTITKTSSGSRRQALGKGLSALLPEKPPPMASSSRPQEADARESVQRLPIDSIEPNPYQPRRIFNKESIEELAQSIRVDGLIQPIVVRPRGDGYLLVVGERRLRAAKIAGFTEIPAIVTDIEADRILEVTLVENIQREDLNPIEVALAMRTMIDQLGLSHEMLAERTGKNRTTITNLLRLLRLPKDIQQLVAERRLSMGHARAILGVDEPQHQRSVAEKAVAQGLSVRQVERTVRRLSEPHGEKDGKATIDPNIAAAIEEMERVLGTRVKLVARGEKRGRIEIEYYSGEDLDRIYEVIVGEAD